MMRKFYILQDKKVVPVDMNTWGEWMATHEDTHVKADILPNNYYVSTIFTGIDHYVNSDPPIVFETMVFPTKSDNTEVDMRRYNTYEEALAGHKKLVKKWEEKRTNH